MTEANTPPGPPPSPPPKVAVVGAGAVGCYYGGMLARAGVPVVLIGRPAHVEAMRRDGLRLTTAAFDGHHPVEASTDMAAVADARLVLVCVKSTDTDAAAASLAPHLAPGARVLSLQNGVDNAARLTHALGVPVAPAVVYVASEMGGPGHVLHNGRGELVIASDIAATGGAPGSAGIVALFASAGVRVALSDNVPGALWAKLVINCGYNAISAISDVPYGPLMAMPGMAQTVDAAVLECVAVAQARGVVLPADLFDTVRRIPGSMPQQVSSTAQDLRRGKATEIDHLNGYIADEGDRLGIATPVNRTLHALVKAIEAGRLT